MRELRGGDGGAGQAVDGASCSVALDHGPRRFSEIRESIGDIGDRMLALRLRDLEDRKLVTRHVIDGPPRPESSIRSRRAGRGFRQVGRPPRGAGARSSSEARPRLLAEEASEASKGRGAPARKGA